MNEWYAGLEPRERLLLIGASAVALVIVLFVFVLRPLGARTAMLEDAVASKQLLLVDLARAQGVVGSLGTARTTEAMYVLADKTAQAHGVTLGNRRPTGSDELSAYFDDVPFDALAIWLVTLSNEHSVRVEQLDARRRERGLVSGRVILLR